MSWLLNKPPKFYFFLYLGSIFIFAIFYSLFKLQFYHSSLKYEPQFVEYSDQVAKAITKDIIKNYKEGIPLINIPEAANKERIDWNGRYFSNLSALHIAYVKCTDDGDITMCLAGELHDVETKTVHIFVSNLVITPPLIRQGQDDKETEVIQLINKFIPFGYEYNPSIDSIGYKFIRTVSTLIPYDLHLANYYRNGIWSVLLKVEKQDSWPPGFSPDDILILFHGNRFILNIEVAEQLSELVQTYRGSPNNTTDNFLRMLYLSAITITTVGYGDIVPVTNWTRGLVAIEAVWGIIIIGLFLNSLADKIRLQNHNQ